MIRAALALLVVALLGVGAGGCGSVHKDGRSASNASSVAPSLGSLMGDQDKDGSGGGYYDSDDGGIRDYGQAASGADAQAITALVKRYYAAVAAEDGTRACALTYYLDVETLPEQYGQPPGPRWLRGANRCRAVLTRVSEYFHSELTAPVVVTGVRVSGSHADALVGFKTLPAGVVKARREGGSWKIDGLLAVALQ